MTWKCFRYIGVYSSKVTCGKFVDLEENLEVADDVYLGQHVEMLVEGFVCCIQRRLIVSNEKLLQATSIARFANWPNVNSDKIEGE